MISLADMKAQLRITTDDDDAIITSKIAVAAEWVANYTGGDATATNLPAPVEEATRLLAAHLFENREASLSGVTAQELPFGVLDMLASYRAWAF